MKHVLIFELLNKMKKKPDFARKLKIFALVGVVVFFITGGLLVWAGYSAIQFIANQANQANIALHLPIAQQQIQSNLSEVQKITQINTSHCWSAAQRLLAIQPWLEKAPFENWTQLKSACLSGNNQSCVGEDCIPDTKLNQPEKEAVI